MNPSGDIFNGHDLADYLGLKRSGIYMWIRRVCIPRNIGTKRHNRWEFSLDDLNHAFEIYSAGKSVRW